MKKTLLLLAALAMAGSAFAQGRIAFSNFALEVTKNTGGVVGDTFHAGLYLVTGSGASATFTLLNMPDGNPGIAGFFAGTGTLSPPNDVVVVPGHPVNSTDSTFAIRAWNGADFASSVGAGLYRGTSATFTAGALGGLNLPNPATPDPGIDNAQSFVVTPEPTTLALGALGFGALLIRRRK